MEKNSISTLLKGSIIGGTMLVPGVSGGSMAMILGIYHRLISSISSFTKDIKKNLVFLALFVCGAGIGMILFANPILKLIENFEMPMSYFFMGAVAGAIPMIYKESEVNKISVKEIFYIAVGLVIVLLLGMLPDDVFVIDTNSGVIGYALLFVAGLVAAVGLVLPGISVSYLFLVMGLYKTTMTAISKLDILFLMPLGIGVLLGILLTTRMLELAMAKYPQITYLIIFGFVLGSLKEIFPGFLQGLEWLICLATAGLGFVVILFLSKFEE